jgi:hypothetical protein
MGVVVLLYISFSQTLIGQIGPAKPALLNFIFNPHSQYRVGLVAAKSRKNI